METLLYLLFGASAGIFIGWLLGRSRAGSALQDLKDGEQLKFTALDKEFATYKASSEGEFIGLRNELIALKSDLKISEKDLLSRSEELAHADTKMATVMAELSSANKQLEEKKGEILDLEQKLEGKTEALTSSRDELTLEKAEHAALQEKVKELGESRHTLMESLEKVQKELLKVSGDLMTSNANREAARSVIREKSQELDNLKEENKTIKKELGELNKEYSTAKANLQALEEKLETQKQEMTDLREDFKKEFTVIANQLLEDNNNKFSNQSKKNLETLLDPLDRNLKEFKEKVEQVYDKESKERFSLGEKVKELAELNQIISKEAKSLTNALKSQSKTQGRWGEMILESILERSGLIKDQEYFMEHELRGDDGRALTSSDSKKKMRPDAVIKYPDNRNVIIDAKVSLNAFTRYLEAEDSESQLLEIKAHVNAIKERINELSKKGYDDYDKALDFVMMFIPSEAAYIAAIKEDPDLWNYAYDRRILLLNPTNLITSLKLIVDLWKREKQNLNAQEIAKRGGKLYDKFVGFATNLLSVGESLDKAKVKFDQAKAQLSTGDGNLVRQAQTLKEMGVPTKKEIPPVLIKEIQSN